MRKLLALLGFVLAASPAFAQQATVFGNTGGGSVTCGAGITGCPSGPLATTFATRAVVLTTDTILAADAAKLVTYSNASPIAVTLPQATGSFAAGFAFSAQNLGVGLVTVTPTTSTVNGAASLTVPTNTGCDFVSDGTNWQIAACSAVAAKFTLTNATNYPQSALTGLGTGVSAALGTNASGSGAICLATGSACASSSTFNSNWVANNWYNSFVTLVGSGVNITTTVTEWVPIYFEKAVTIGSLGAKITTTNAGNMQMSVYAADASTGLPTGSALCTTASLSTAGAGGVPGTCSAALTAGRYWLGLQVDNATAAVLSSNGSSTLNSLIGVTSQTSLSGSGTFAGTEYKTTGGTFGTWPTNPTITQAATSGNVVPLLQFKIASVP